MPIPSRSLIRLVALGVTSAAAVVFTASVVRPTFLSKRVGPRISIPVATSDERALLRAPWARLSYTDALATSIFLWDRSAFAMDLMGTGKVGVARALALADVAVREAYRRQVPPALVLGVMLTENDEVKSTARSPQGAVGLMQIHPRPWRPALGKLFGMNLRNDTTNLRYGIFIRSDCWGERRLVVHELVHTWQYERLGGFRPFLQQYLHECITIGYPAAPLEQEAKRIESEMCA